VPTCIIGIVTHCPCSSEEKRAVQFNWGSQKVRGVSLGGWLVLESFITPSLYNAAGAGVVDEWTYCEKLGKTEAKKRLTKHWDSFVTLADFQRLSRSGFNVVRIPIGVCSVAFPSMVAIR
jgi:glucan 1,3-beta-glucosidase